MTISSSAKYNDNQWHNIIVTHNNSSNAAATTNKV